MTSIEKSTITLPKAAAVILVVAGFVAQYYTTQNAVKDGFNSYKLETESRLKDIEGEQKVIKSTVDGIDKRLGRMENSVASYIGKAILPETPRIKSENE